MPSWLDPKILALAAFVVAFQVAMFLKARLERRWWLAARPVDEARAPTPRSPPDVGTETESFVDAPSLPSSRVLAGMAGERAVRMAVNGAGFYAFHDVTIPTLNGNGTQIDHVVVAGRSIVCIETKNWAGKVSGGRRDKDWTQSRADVTRSLPNPLLQNEYHMTQMSWTAGDVFKDLGSDVRGFVVMVGDIDIDVADRRGIQPLDNLSRCLRTVGELGSGEDENRCWVRLQRLAARQGWIVGEVHAPMGVL